MRITIHRESFAPAFAAATAVAPTNPSKATLRYVLLTATASGEVTLFATDYEQAVRIPVTGAEVDKPGRCLLNPATFGQVLREATDDSLVVQLGDQKDVQVIGSRSQYSLLTEDPEDYPDWKDDPGEGNHGAPAESLKQAIERTMFCCDLESARYALGGVLFEVKGRRMTLAGTDGRRMSICSLLALPAGQKDKDGAHVVPQRALKSLRTLLADSEETVEVTLNANNARFATSRFVFTARLLEGRFPQHKAVIEGVTFEHELPIACGPLAKLIRQASVACSKETHAVNFLLSDGELTLAAENADKGSSRVAMPLAFNSDALKTMLSGKFLLEALKTFPDEATLTLRVKDSETQVQLTSGDEFTYVVMPLSRDE